MRISRFSVRNSKLLFCWYVICEIWHADLLTLKSANILSYLCILFCFVLLLRLLDFFYFYNCVFSKQWKLIRKTAAWSLSIFSALWYIKEVRVLDRYRSLHYLSYKILIVNFMYKQLLVLLMWHCLGGRFHFQCLFSSYHLQKKKSDQLQNVWFMKWFMSWDL